MVHLPCFIDKDCSYHHHGSKLPMNKWGPLGVPDLMRYTGQFSTPMNEPEIIWNYSLLPYQMQVTTYSWSLKLVQTESYHTIIEPSCTTACLSVRIKGHMCMEKVKLRYPIWISQNGNWNFYLRRHLRNPFLSYPVPLYPRRKIKDANYTHAVFIPLGTSVDKPHYKLTVWLISWKKPSCSLSTEINIKVSSIERISILLQFTVEEFYSFRDHNSQPLLHENQESNFLCLYVVLGLWPIK